MHESISRISIHSTSLCVYFYANTIQFWSFSLYGIWVYKAEWRCWHRLGACDEPAWKLRPLTTTLAL